MTTTLPSSSTLAIPAGTWRLDPTHSSAGFSVKHMAVATFRGSFEQLDALLDVGDDGNARLTGSINADSLLVKDENLKAHLRSPEFFDTERFPEVKFVSTSIRRDGDEVEQHESSQPRVPRRLWCPGGRGAQAGGRLRRGPRRRFSRHLPSGGAGGRRLGLGPQPGRRPGGGCL